MIANPCALAVIDAAIVYSSDESSYWILKTVTALAPGVQALAFWFFEAIDLKGAFRRLFRRAEE